MKWLTAVSSILLIVLLVSTQCLAVQLPDPQKEEERLGRQYSKEIEKNAELVDDPAVVERIQRIGAELAKIANEHEVKASYGSSQIYKFDYQFKVIKDKEINAFSLPGGIIYVNTGLLDIIESDDELAGVLAHEIAHASHHHMTYLMKRQSKVDRYIALITLATVLGRLNQRDLNNVLMGAQMIRTGKMSSYTQIAERDADRTAVAYLARSKYNPEGMLNFMKKLDRKREENPTLPLGIYQTHPSPFRRIDSITEAMREEGFNVDLRKVYDVAFAKAEPPEGGSDRYRVVIGERTVFMPAPLPQGLTSKDRAEAIAARINQVLDSGICEKDICQNGTTISVRGQEIIRAEPEDSPDLASVLQNAKKALCYGVWADWLWNDCRKMLKSESNDSD
jgi:hypothetical protein